MQLAYFIPLLGVFLSPLSLALSSSLSPTSPGPGHHPQKPWCRGLAAKGNLEVLQALVDTLMQASSDVAGSNSGNWKEEAINALTWGRFLKDVLNARTSQGETALILACIEGCVWFPAPRAFTCDGVSSKLASRPITSNCSLPSISGQHCLMQSSHGSWHLVSRRCMLLHCVS